MKNMHPPTSNLCMKKLLVLSAVLVATAMSSHAGVRFGFGVGLPLPVPPLPGIVVGQTPAYAPAPPPVCYDAPQAYYGAPTVVVQPPSFYYGVGPGHYRYSYPHYRNHRWDHRGHGRHDGHRW